MCIFLEIGPLGPVFFGCNMPDRGGRTPAGLLAPLPAYHWATAQSAYMCIFFNSQ
jgi:hypothetical protein